MKQRKSKAAMFKSLLRKVKLTSQKRLNSWLKLGQSLELSGCRIHLMS